MARYTPKKINMDTKHDALEHIIFCFKYGVIFGIYSSTFRGVNQCPSYFLSTEESADWEMLQEIQLAQAGEIGSMYQWNDMILVDLELSDT